MLFKPITNRGKKRNIAFIYAVVFNSSFSVFLVFALFASFAVQPIHQAYANEATVEITEVETPTTADDVSPQVEIPETEEATVAEEVPVEDVTIQADTEISIMEEVSTSEQDESVASDKVEDLEVEFQVSTTTHNELLEEEIVTNNSEVVDNENSNSAESNNQLELEALEDEETESPDDEQANINQSENTEISTSTQTTLELVVNEVKAESLVTDANYYQFSKTACVAVGDGTYHCSLDSNEGINSQATVFSEIGPNANKEIYLRTSTGEVRQLTNNEYDDTAPSYDSKSMQIVWQRLIDGRYQIIVYDIQKEQENQLTFSRTNNMEPKVSEDGIVWQAWDGNDWEIMYFDGKYTDQITDNDFQDVAPAIDEGYILWSVLGGKEQEAKVYEIASGEVLTINGYEGGLISNPRFVLVYDTQFDNGDVITQGFDPLTGLSAPIAAKPAENPIDIPETDSTGETRALIQNKTSQKDELILSTSGEGNATSTDGTPNQNIATSTSTSTLNLKATTTEVFIPDIEAATSTTTPLELTDYDLILLPDPSTSATNTEITTE